MRRHVDMYQQVFTPGRPVITSELFVGRCQEEEDIRKVLTRPGQHALVLGDRGVGKTTLVKQVLAEQKRPVVWRTCSPNLSFDEVMRGLLCDLEIDVTTTEIVDASGANTTAGLAPQGIGVSGGKSKEHAEHSRPLEADKLTPWRVFQLLHRFSPKAVLVIDEYDAIRDGRKSAETLHENLAYTIKALSDHSDRCDVKIIVVGIAHTAEEMIGKHRSIERNAREIYLQPLRAQDFHDFIDEASRLLRIEFEPRVRLNIAEDAMGFPYYVHLVCLCSVEAMLARDRQAETVDWRDYQQGIERAVEEAFRAELSKHRDALRRMSTNARTLCQVLAQWQSRGAYRQSLFQALAEYHDLTENDCRLALAELENDLRVVYVARHLDQIRFSDPLLKPFLREKLRGFRVKKKKEATRSLFDDLSDERDLD